MKNNTFPSPREMASTVVYLGPFDDEKHYADDLGATRTMTAPTELAAAWYLRERWPSLCIGAYKQRRGGKADRQVLWIFRNKDDPKPVAAVLSEDGFDWDLWTEVFAETQEAPW
jgi:hypothetical protein